MKINKLIIPLIFIAVFGFLFVSGTLTSGFHFTDDHQIISATTELSKESTINVASQWIKTDMDLRFRPMYYAHRVIEAKILGTNYTLWSIWTALLACTTFSFFYLGMRKLKFTIFESLLFLVLAFVGTQMDVWWRLGPAETIGTFFLSLAFYFLNSCNKRYTLNTILFSLSIIFSSLCKESFIIIIPAFIVLKLWIEKDFFKISLKEVFWKNRLLAILLFVMSFELWIIIYYIGVNKIGYAGVDQGILAILSGSLKIITTRLNLFLIIIFVSLALTLYKYKKDKKKIGQLLINLLLPAVFASIIVLPNLILYAKSGMGGRYFLPTTIGIAFLIVSILKQIENKYSWIYKLLVVCIILFHAKPVYTTILKSKSFAKEGHLTSKMLTIINKNSDENSNILFVGNPAAHFEWSYSLNKYLITNKNIYMYVYPLNDNYKSEFKKGLSKNWHTWFKGRKFSDINGEIDIIICFDKKLIENIFEENDLQHQNYKNLLVSNDNYVVYIKKVL